MADVEADRAAAMSLRIKIVSKSGLVLMAAAAAMSYGVLTAAQAGANSPPSDAGADGRHGAVGAAQAAPSAEALASGKETFAHYCSACHGPTGRGGPAPEGGKPARDLTQAAFQDSKTDAQLFSVVHDGVPPDFFMEAWSDRLSDAQIGAVVQYVRTLRTPVKTGPGAS